MIMTSIDAKVLETAMSHDRLLTALSRYVSAYVQMLPHLPAQSPVDLVHFIGQVKKDVNLARKLDLPVNLIPEVAAIKPDPDFIAPVIARHYDELEEYFTPQPSDFVGGGGQAVQILDYLAYFIRDIRPEPKTIHQLKGKVSWITESEYKPRYDDLQRRLAPLFTQYYIDLDNQVLELLEKADSKAVERWTPRDYIATLTPLLKVELEAPSALQGTLYLMQRADLYRVLLDVGRQRQVEFNALPSDLPGVPDEGYQIDTITEGSLLFPKLRLKSALEKIDTPKGEYISWEY